MILIAVDLQMLEVHTSWILHTGTPTSVMGIMLQPNIERSALLYMRDAMAIGVKLVRRLPSGRPN